MKTNYEIRYAAHPEDAKHYDTTRIRRDFLIERVFTHDEVNMVYSMYDRMTRIHVPKIPSVKIGLQIIRI